MKKLIYSFMLVTALASCSSNTQEKPVGNPDDFVNIEGVNFPKEIKKGDTTLVLNGGGVRTFLFIKVYVGAIYLPEKSTNPDHIIEADEPQIIRLHAVSRAYTSARMASTVRDQFEKSNKGNTAPFQSRLDIMLEKLANEDIQVGDMLDIAYTPEEGLNFYKNGKSVNIQITGLDFKQALWRDWLSDSPADESLKKGMLGLH